MPRASRRGWTPSHSVSPREIGGWHRILLALAGRMPPCRPASERRELAPRGRARPPGLPRRRCLSRQFRLPRVRMEPAVPQRRAARPRAVSRGLRGGCGQRSRPAVPARLRRQDLHPAPARRGQARARVDRHLDRRPRHGRRSGDAPARRLRPRDVGAGPPRAADRRRPLLHRVPGDTHAWTAGGTAPCRRALGPPARRVQAGCRDHSPHAVDVRRRAPAPGLLDVAHHGKHAPARARSGSGSRPRSRWSFSA